MAFSSDIYPVSTGIPRRAEAGLWSLKIQFSGF